MSQFVEMQPTKSNSPNSQNLQTSVAMCTYNGARFLPKQLETIAFQTVPPGELIVCDDGSTDETVSIITDFSKRVRFPVSIFQNEQKLGPAKNFEKAIGLCLGEIILLSDQDDLWIPTKIQTLLQAFSNDPDAVYAFSDAEMVDETGAKLGRKLWNAVGFSVTYNNGQYNKQLELLLTDNFITGAAMAFRSSFRNVILPISPGWMHDYWIGLLGSTFSHGIPITECLFSYRRHSTQVVGWGKKNYWQVSKDSLSAGKEGAFRKLQQFQNLLERIASQGTLHNYPPERMLLLKEKEFHMQHRAKIRSSRLFFRFVRVFREALTGRYSRFSSSPWSSIFRDLCH